MEIRMAAGIGDYRRIAKRRLPDFLFHYFDGAANDELTAARNTRDLDGIEIEQRVMRDVGTVSTECTLFDQKLSMPVILGPIGLAGLLARRGEVQAAAAARAAEIPFCLSTYGLCSPEEVHRAAGAHWFQLYMLRDRGFTAELLARARALQAPVLILTVDTPVTGVRYRDRRSGLNVTTGLDRLRQAIQAASRPRWLWDVALRGRPLIFGGIAPAVPHARTVSDFWSWLGANLNPHLTWADIAFVRRHWPGPLLVKGILDPRDATAAIDAGADGVIVSNHGGRQLDSVCSAITALPRVVDAVAGRAPVLMDGGIRSGIDVLKAIDRGAAACLLGRAWAFSLAAGGEAGVSQMLADMQRELAVALALSGRDRLPDILGSDLASELVAQS